MAEPKQLKEYIREELDKLFKKVLAEAPWWCMVCGDGGNYEDERPDEYLPPPLDHVCKETHGNPEGILQSRHGL